MVQNDQTENGPSRPPSKSYSIFNKFKIKKTERSSTFSEAPSTKFSLPLRSSTAGDLESKLSTTTKSRLEIIFAPTQRYPRSKLPTSPEPPESDDIVRGITGALELKIETTELDSTSAGSPNGSKQAEAVPVDAVFRVALVPLGTSLDGFNEAFSTIFPTLLKELTALCNAPNCNAPNRNCNYLIALVQFSKTPDVLEKLPRDASHHFNLAFEPGCTKPVKIKIDRNFQDLTQMYPVEGVISADVVAVCGLMGHAYGSWSAKSHDGHRTMWLRSFMEQDYPQVRTMVYGYDAAIDPKSTTITQLPDYANDFLEVLKLARSSEEEKNRLLILIGHSFGGIIIAQSVVNAKEKKHYNEIFESTRAMIFFGTPHRGLLVDDLLRTVGEKSTRERLIESLKSGSEELQRVLDRFIDYIQLQSDTDDRKLMIQSFKETKQTKRLGLEGSFRTTVDERSGVLSIGSRLERISNAEGDHSTMVKLKDEDCKTYTIVRNFIGEIIGSAGIGNDQSSFCTPYNAIMMMDSDRLKRALRGVNVNALHKNLLHLAITKNTPECAKELILNHCNLEARDENGFTPLHTAVLEGQEWAVELLYNNGAILDALVLCSRPCDDCHLSCFNGMMPVHLAVNTRTAAVSMMKFLLGLKRGKRVTVNKPAHDEDRHTALHYAARHGNLEMIELLLKSGAKVSDLGGKDGESPLHTAAWWNMVAATKLLIDKGADINLADNNGCTPLHIAAGRGNILVVNLLYEEGADHKATDGSGRTVLHHAASWGHVGLVELCLDNGADINAVSKTNGWTALHIAARECHAKTVELLRCRGADSSLRYIGASTDTRLEVAMRKGHTRAHLLEDIPFSCP